tara:strand:- start:53 stop:283 length:231 start_codon:yes stop_codon:yes gene_type:complete
MKKSNKKTPSIKQLTKDFDKLFSFYTGIDDMDLTKIDDKGINEIRTKAKKLEEEIRNRYKGFYSEEDIKKDLDTDK